MDSIWSALGIGPTEDVSVIKRAYAEKAKTCHPEEDPEGFLVLRQAYQAALDYAEGTRDEPGFSLAEPPPEEETGPVPVEDEGWHLQEQEDDSPNPYEGGEAITKFLELYTGKQRKNPAMWMNYITSDAFLDAAWDPQFTSLLLRKVREVQAEFPPNQEFMTWLNVAYPFSGGEAHSFDGISDILQIAALGPVPKTPKGNVFAVLQSFLDYRHLNRLADAGRWDQEAIEAFREVVGRYSQAYIRERCEQRVTPDCERHPAGVRVFLHFFQREDLPEVLFREAWQRLELKTAVMGRAKVLYGPLRELAIQRVPGIAGEAPPVNFLQLTRNLDAYLKRIYANPESEPEESRAFFESAEMQRALPEPRFLEKQLLVNSPWRREGMGEGLIRRMLEYYRAHPDIPWARKVISGLEGDLLTCEVKRWNREDDEADLEGIPYYVRLTLAHRPLFRWWLNTAFYTARDPETGTPLSEYLEKYLPYQEAWSRRFAEREDKAPRTIAAAMGTVEIDCYPMHLEYRVNGEPMYRPCLTWEQTVEEGGDWFAFLLPITAAPREDYIKVSRAISRRIGCSFLPRDVWAGIVRCLAGYVCCLPQDEEMGEAVLPEKELPMELSMEGGGKLYTAVWSEEGEPGTIYRQTFSGRRFQERLEPNPNETRLEAARRRLKELTDPRFFDLSRLRKLPWHLYFTPNGGMEEELLNEEIIKPDPEEGETVPETAENQAEESSIPPEKLISPETISDVLYRFSQDELERVEMGWSEGILVLRRDGDNYACLYFENSFGRGDHWYALLADVDMYRTVDGSCIKYIPFGMGKLAEYSIFHSVRDLLQNIDLVLGQMGWGQLESGGRSGWLWSCAVNLQDSKHKLLMAQQKLGGVPPVRGRNYYRRRFVFSRFASELESVDTDGVPSVRTLRSGTYGFAGAELDQFMADKLEKVRISWTFQTRDGGTELRHLVLLQEQGKYMMFWLQDGDQRAWAYGSDEPRWFMGRALPGCLVHEDVKRLRNGIDLLLDDIDNTEPVLTQPGQFAEVRMPYEELRTALVHEADQEAEDNG